MRELSSGLGLELGVGGGRGREESAVQNHLVILWLRV